MQANTAAATHIRNRVKAAGIVARVRVAPGGGCIQVFAPAFGVKFTEEEQRQIRLIGKCNGFTWVRGMEIDIEQMTNPDSFNFYAGKLQ